MNLDKVIKKTVERYEKILDNYYPSFGSIGFTERNLTFNFCSCFYNIAAEKDLVIWQEVPIENSKSNKKEHFDSLIISRKAKKLYLVEAKRINSKNKIDSVESDLKRIRNNWKNINIDEETKGYSKHAVIIADIWIPHSNEKAKKAKEYLLKQFNNKFKNAIIKEVKKKNGPLTEKERYYILCYTEEL
jgi:hypothetical protein